jgi:tryptophanyl-tRNA synthetase
MRVLSGIQPTARFHWGNYFGAIRQHIELQGNEQAFYFIADLHALTTVRDAEQLRAYTREAAMTYLALGLDPNRATLFRQSDVPEVTELCWILMTVTQMHLLEQCHAYKDKKARGLPADAGLFTYPVLMAADILLYDSERVPVGADQVQHIYLARDVAGRFNSIFGETLTLPTAHVVEAAAKVPGLDGQKMSKSYGNAIDIFEDPKSLKKKIMSIKTDSKTVDEPKNPDDSLIYELYKLFASPDQLAALAARYRAGGMGYGEAKQALYEASLAYFAEPRARYAELRANPGPIEEILAVGAKRARAKGRDVLDRVRKACGIA